MSRVIKNLLNLFPFLYLLIVGSTQGTIAQNSITPKIIKIEIFDSSNGDWINQTTSFQEKKSLLFNESSSNLKIILEEIDSIYSNHVQYSYRLGTKASTCPNFAFCVNLIRSGFGLLSAMSS